MAMIECPECGEQISERAPVCPHCGAPGTWQGGFEYKSDTTVLGLPLVHFVGGMAFNPMTGRPRIARGIIAVGPIAVGVFAAGGLSLGIFAFGGLALGLAVFGGLAVGLGIAFGGLAIGTVAFGGAAIGYYALGGGAFGVHALGGNARDPEAVEFFSRLLGDWVTRLGAGGGR